MPVELGKLDFSAAIPFNELHHVIHLLKLNAVFWNHSCICLNSMSLCWMCNLSKVAGTPIYCSTAVIMLGLISDVEMLGRISSSIKINLVPNFDHTQTQVLKTANRVLQILNRNITISIGIIFHIVSQQVLWGEACLGSEYV